jgi:hypothetical protein
MGPIGIPDQGVHQRLPGGRVLPVAGRLARRGIVVLTLQPRSHLGLELRWAGPQQRVGAGHPGSSHHRPDDPQPRGTPSLNVGHDHSRSQLTGDLVDRGLQGGDRVAGALGGGHRAGQAELGPVLDHPAHAPYATGQALQLAAGRSAHTVASGRRVGEDRPPGLGELAALGLVADRLQHAPASQVPSHRGLAGRYPGGGQQPQILRWPQAALLGVLGRQRLDLVHRRCPAGLVGTVRVRRPAVGSGGMPGRGCSAGASGCRLGPPSSMVGDGNSSFAGDSRSPLAAQNRGQGIGAALRRCDLSEGAR